MRSLWVFICNYAECYIIFDTSARKETLEIVENVNGFIVMEKSELSRTKSAFKP